MLVGDYQILSVLNGQMAQLTFRGGLDGREVRWNCEFVTLKKEYKRLCGSSSTGSHPSIRCFIEIDAVEVPASIRVGLNLPLINAPAIEKMILMVRNYKHLRPGRHEFGEFYPAE